MTTHPSFTGEYPLLPELEPHLDQGEQIVWAGRPYVFSTLRTYRVLWWIGGVWIALVIAAYFSGFASSGALEPLGMVGCALIAAPFILLYGADKTVYAITNKRALILRSRKNQIVSVPFERMDAELEILDTGKNSGHLYFASNLSTKMRDTDYTGKLAFRDIKNPREIARVLNVVRKR